MFLEANERIQPDRVAEIISSPDLLFNPSGFVKRFPQVGKDQIKFQSLFFAHQAESYLLGKLANDGYYLAKNVIKDEMGALLDIAHESRKWSITNKEISIGKSITFNKKQNEAWCPKPDLLIKLLKIISENRLFSDLLISLPRNYRLDKIQFHATYNYRGFNSTQWHRDSVGNRQKVFLILTSDIYAPTTCLVPASNYEVAYSLNADLIRTFKTLNNQEYSVNEIAALQSQLQSQLCKRARRDVFKVNQDQGDIFFFDTNCWHEGWNLASMDYQNADLKGLFWNLNIWIQIGVITH